MAVPVGPVRRLALLCGLGQDSGGLQPPGAASGA